MKTVLVLGATGYIGDQLTRLLVESGRKIRCLVRDPRKVTDRPGREKVEIFEGDALDKNSLEAAFDGVDIVFYLIHSMASGEKRFEGFDRLAAENVAAAAAEKNVERIIYLGGLGRRSSDQSPHLRSRHEVGRILRSGKVSVTEFRAAVVVGSGSTSFEMVHHLVNRLPFMICPRWVKTRTQPIALDDVLKYLMASIEKPETAGKIIDIGGPEVTTYGKMMETMADVLGLRRYMLQVPVLTPRLSSYWVNLVTPIKAGVARALIEGLRYETVCENDDAHKYFELRPISFRQAAQKALAGAITGQPTDPSDGSSGVKPFETIHHSHLRYDRREMIVSAPGATVFETVASLGGDNGWYYADWLWKLRGLIDKLLGGEGLRKGRPDRIDLKPGEKIDFWRLVKFDSGREILLEAEMNVWGKAWLEFISREADISHTRLTQTAIYYPRGLFGFVYWYAVYPLHQVIFRGLIRAIATRSERVFAGR